MALAVDAHWTLADAPSGIVHVVRSEEPYPSLESIAPSFEALLGRLDQLGRANKAIIIDFRGGPPPRNDDAFEKATQPFRPRLFEGFVAGGVLVRSAAGRMQLTRTSRQDQGAYVVSSDQAELEAYLAERLAEAG